MALLDRAIRWLDPGVTLPWRHIDAPNPATTNTVPARIQRQFIESSGSLPLLRTLDVEYKVIKAAQAEWRQSRHSAVALLGAFGAGKTTLLRSIEASRRETPLIHHRFTSRVLGKTQMLSQLSYNLGLSSDEMHLDDLAASLQAGPKQIILLDDCHLLFLRRPGGFVPLDLLLRLIRATDRHILWITTWNIYSWMYLKHVRSLSDHFATVHPISALSQEYMQRMLMDRLSRTGLQVVWPEDEMEAILRAIWAGARGRPSLAQHIFLRSLYPAGDGTYTVQADAIYRPPKQCNVKDSEEAYALDNLIRHTVLTARELASVNHIDETQATAILARTAARGLTVSLEPDYRLNPVYADAIIAYLDSRRATSFREVRAG